MIIKKIVSKEKKVYKKLFNFFLISYFFVTALIGLLFFLFLINSHFLKSKVSNILDHLSKAGRIEYIYILDIARQAFLSNFYKLETLDINISFDNIIKLESDREKAIKFKSLGFKDELNEVNAEFIFRNKKALGRLKLKGDRLMHFEDKEKSSYSIDLKNNNYILGLNNLSIQKPGTRNYIHEWIFHEMMSDFDLIKPKYEFIDVKINGSNKGLYALEERMGKEIIERNKRRYGPIFSADQDFITDNSEDRVIQIYNEKFWYGNENIKLANLAKTKLESFLRGDEQSEGLIDEEKFAAFFAVMDATYTYHALFWNSKIYYNPVSGLFEPIPRDGHRNLPNYHKFNNNYYNKIILDSLFEPETRETEGFNLQIAEGRKWWINKFFRKKNGELNHSFIEKYLSYLKIISSEDYIKNFLNERADDIKRINSHIYSDYFFYAGTREYGYGLYYFMEEDLYYRAKIIRDKIVSLEKKIQVFETDKNVFKINIANEKLIKRLVKNDRPINFFKVENITCYKNEKLEEINLNEKLIFSYSENFSVDINNAHSCTIFKIRDLITKKVFMVNIENINRNYNFDKFSSREKILKINDYFNEKNNILKLKKDIVEINESIYVPSGRKIILNPGQKIILKNNAFIISDSPWIVIGNEQNPIYIGGIKTNFGGGLFIKNSKEKSEFDNVKFSYLSGFRKDYFNEINQNVYLNVTENTSENNYIGNFIKKPINKISNEEYIIYGAVNIFNTKVKIKNSSFSKIYSEDGLNLINTNFYLENLKFKDVYSDAIDFDFSEGLLRNLNFEQIGNDAIDFSGSDAEVNNVNLKNIGDKIISVGENSNILIQNINAENSYVGIASKDGSLTKANNIKFKNILFPFSSYNKKLEYRPANLIINDFYIDDYNKNFILDKNGSKIFVKNEEVGFKTNKLLEIIYGRDLEVLNE